MGNCIRNTCTEIYDKRKAHDNLPSEDIFLDDAVDILLHDIEGFDDFDHEIKEEYRTEMENIFIQDEFDEEYEQMLDEMDEETEQEERKEFEYLDSYDYLMESFINGNFSQCRSIMKNFSGYQYMDFCNWLFEEGHSGFIGKFSEMLHDTYYH